MALKRIFGETLVNSTTFDSQSGAAVAGLASGAYVIAWTGGAGNNELIYAQLYGPDYVRLGTEIALSAARSEQEDVAVAGLGGGGFVAVWEAELDGGTLDIVGRRFAANGAPLSAEFQVNIATDGSQSTPQVANMAGLGFAVVWESPDGSGDGVYLRRYLNDGTGGLESQVNTFTQGLQGAPSVTGLVDGGLIVAWQSANQAGAASGYDIYAQRYNSVGTRVGQEFQVNTAFTAGDQDDVQVATLADGKFVFVWESQGEDGDGDGIVGRLYNADATPAGASFQVNTFVSGNQTNPAVAAFGDGGFVVAWQSAGQDGSSNGVYAQAYRPDATRDGAEFRVNTTTAGSQDSAAVAGLTGTRAVVAWESSQQVDGDDIFAQAFGAPLDVYRFYNNANGVHFFTISAAERDAVIGTLPSFRFEGVDFAAAPAASGDTATVYRFYNTQNGAHFYTMNPAERDNVIATLPHFNYEGPSYYAYTAPVDGAVPLYRFYNVLTGAHFFTATEGEKNTVVATLPEFRFEGVAYYVDPVNG